VAERLNFDDRQAPDELYRSSLVPRTIAIGGDATGAEPASSPLAEKLAKEPAQ
jgi:hypothetical protein